MLTDGDRPGILPHLIVFSICDDRQCHQTSSLSHFVREPFDGAAVDADRGWAMSVKGAYRQDDSIGPLEGLFSLLPGHIPETMFLHPKAPPRRTAGDSELLQRKGRSPVVIQAGGFLSIWLGSVLFRFVFSPRAGSPLQSCGVSSTPS